MPPVKLIAIIIEIKMERTLEILIDSRRFSTGNNKTARRQAKAKGIKIFCAT
jgi:hypothetical protein